MAGYYDPNIGWVEFSDAEAATLPSNEVLPWQTKPSYFVADPFGGGGNYVPEVTPTGPQADPNNWENFEGLWLDKSAPMDWSLGLGSFGENMLNKNFQNELTTLSKNLYGRDFSDLDWQKALLEARGWFNQNGMHITPNTSDAYLKQVMLQKLGERNGLDMTKYNAMVNTPDWQNYFNTSAQQAGQQNTQYQAMSKNPMPWPVKLIAAATGGLMGYGALAGMGLAGAGAGSGMMDMGQWAAMDSMGGLEGIAGGASGAGAGAGAMDTSWWDSLGSIWDEAGGGANWGSFDQWLGSTTPDVINYAGTAAGQNGILGGLMDAYNALPAGLQSVVSGLGSTPTSLLKMGLQGLLGGGSGGMGSIFGGLGNLLGAGGLTGQGGGYNFDLGGILGALLEYQGQNKFQDKLDEMMNKAAGAADPYGLGPYRQPMAQRLEQSYRDPLSVWQSPEMQALDTQMSQQQMARDAAAGTLANAPERLAQRQNNFLTQALPAYRQGLQVPSGATFAPKTSEAYTSAMMPMAAAELGKSAAIGYGVNSAMYGRPQTLATQLFGLPQQSTLWDWMKSFGNGSSSSTGSNNYGWGM